MYKVAVNGSTAASVSSYEKAIPAAREAATAAANSILARAESIRANTRLYRSPKSRANVAAALVRQAKNVIGAVTRPGVFPKKSGNVIVSAGGVTIEVLKA